MNEKKVSIVVPVYKVEQFLERCVRSLLAQTYKNMEIILVDDGSPDKCPEMCDQFAQDYECIKVIHKKNGGLSSARLAGFRIASGEYMLFVDSDDYIDVTMVEKLYNAIENKNAELAICGYYTQNKDNISANLLPYAEDGIYGRKNIIDNYILPLVGKMSNAINIPGFFGVRMFRRSLIREEYFLSENKYFMEDHVFNLIYADGINNIAIVNEPLYYYCINRSSLSNCFRKNKWQMYVNLLQFFTEYLQERDITDGEKRLENFVSSAVFSAVDNAILAGDYLAYRKELNAMLDSELLNSFLNNKSEELSSMQKIVKALLQKHLYRILYWLRGWRISRVYQ